MADHNGQREPATPEEVWSILREVAESQRETDRRMQETDRRMQETDRRLRKLDDLFNGQWGKLMEALVEGDLIKLLNQRGIQVASTLTNLKQHRGPRRWEIDILAANGDEVVVVEVKNHAQGAPRQPLDRAVTGVHGAGAGVCERAGIWGRRLSESRRILGRLCGRTGAVRDSRHRQQRQHHQPGQLQATHVLAARVWPQAGRGDCSVRIHPGRNLQ